MSRLQEAIENIDIGGPTLLRAAAKNFQDVTVIVDPADYDVVLGEIKRNREVSYNTQIQACSQVFEHTAHYDALIAEYLRKQSDGPIFPDVLTLTYEKVQDLRYGENPHQQAVFYKEVAAVPEVLLEPGSCMEKSFPLIT